MAFELLPFEQKSSSSFHLSLVSARLRCPRRQGLDPDLRRDHELGRQAGQDRRSLEGRDDLEEKQEQAAQDLQV